MVKFLASSIDKNLKYSSRFSKYTIFLLIIIGVAISTKMYFFPSQLPVNFDSIYYFLYSSDIYLTNQLPQDWSPTNNGWPIFVSLFFMIFDSKDAFTLMQIQKLLSITISILIIIPVYFLCKKYVSRKFAIIGASLIAFEPRMMINSFLGLTEPLYLLLVTTSLVLFLQSNKKLVYFSFFVVALATLVRGEGITLFMVMSIMFFIRYRREKLKVILKYLLVLGIFALVILPMSMYRTDVIGVDGIVMRSLSSGDDLVSDLTANTDSKNNVLNGIELFGKIFVWMMVPSFIIFIPLGVFLVLRNRNFEKYTLILSIGVLSLPAFYAYTNSVLDTRYFFILLPLFAVLSVVSIDKMVSKLRKSNAIVFSIIIIIFVASLVFYDYQKPDGEFEKESLEITEEIFPIIEKKNMRGMDGYFRVIHVMEQWPMEYTEMKTDGKGVTTSGYNSLGNFIDDSRSEGLSHIVIDVKKDRLPFLSEIFYGEEKFPYLKKVYDSQKNGFKYHVKVFEIDYKAYYIMQDNRD